MGVNLHMSRDPDVATAAALLVARYGERARLRAVHRAGKLLGPRDAAARQLWIDVIRTIDELQRRDADGTS